MVNQKKQLIKDLGIKLGSDEMVFWRDVIDGLKIGLKSDEASLEAMQKNIKYNKAVLELAENKYKEAEVIFSKK